LGTIYRELGEPMKDDISKKDNAHAEKNEKENSSTDKSV
jgi:hypothetical protein